MAHEHSSTDGPVPQEPVETTPQRARGGMRGADILAVLALSTFLAAVGLTTFFLTTAVGG